MSTSESVDHAGLLCMVDALRRSPHTTVLALHQLPGAQTGQSICLSSLWSAAALPVLLHQLAPAITYQHQALASL